MTEFEYNIFRCIAEHAVSDAVEKEKIEEESAVKISVKSYPKSMYAGVIYYYKVIFKKTVTLENDSENDRVIKGFHIMPYRINAEDIKKAEKSRQDRRINEFIKSDSSFVNYDKGSGNFHKVPDGEFQVVLLDTTAKPDGPGEIKNDDKRDKNYNMYFPHPDSKNVHKGNDPAKLIKDAMENLKANEKKE